MEGRRGVFGYLCLHIIEPPLHVLAFNHHTQLACGKRDVPERCIRGRIRRHLRLAHADHHFVHLRREAAVSALSLALSLSLSLSLSLTHTPVAQSYGVSSKFATE